MDHDVPLVVGEEEVEYTLEEEGESDGVVVTSTQVVLEGYAQLHMKVHVQLPEAHCKTNNALIHPYYDFE